MKKSNLLFLGFLPVLATPVIALSCANPSNPGPKKPEHIDEPGPDKPGDQGNPENKPKEKQADKHETPDNTTPPIVNPQKLGEGKKEDDNISNDKNAIIKKFEELRTYYYEMRQEKLEKIKFLYYDLMTRHQGIYLLTREKVIQDNLEIFFFDILGHEIDEKINSRFSKLEEEKNMHKDVDEELLKKIKELITEFSKEKGDKLIEEFSEKARAEAKKILANILAKQEELYKKLTELLEKITHSQTKEYWKAKIKELYTELALTDELLQQLK
ncbi:hypothetical protein ACT1UH_00070 [Mycoplasma sp. 332]|uniref:hypothetical protein n=1 Tax=Mycoplasma sp. 332 TaxID=3458236 RepID=UPI004036B989